MQTLQHCLGSLFLWACGMRSAAAQPPKALVVWCHNASGQMHHMQAVECRTWPVHAYFEVAWDSPCKARDMLLLVCHCSSKFAEIGSWHL